MHDGAILLLDERLIVLLVGAERGSSFYSRHHRTTTSFMKALSLSKSAGARTQGRGSVPD
ncbi:hypothetical protein IVA88_28180 [Bradyrhizobium sp. 149]|uniref:hypothetical protein n=1 Tax=Bradyrhizobium sp. 149 TaxID=2782624 RepID=UPI001FF9174B|nr:hypothetical protein [Bradyrhizobium sp. 149]MCK1655291.1 hypothetical protein [Bradyrhizobium sp. 149]